MITKERFGEVITFIKDKKAAERTFSSACLQLTPDFNGGGFIYSDYETMLIKTLKAAMNLPDSNDDIEYFIYELNFGKDYHVGMVVGDNGPLDFSSVDSLYEYLLKIVDKE